MQTKGGTQSKASAPISEPVVIFFDGSGCRRDGKGSGFSWFCPATRQRHVERVDGLTNNQAEYKGLLSALQHVPEGSSVTLYSDSDLIVSQFCGTCRVKDYALQDLLSAALGLILKKQLKVKLQWVPRSQNLAGRLL